MKIHVKNITADRDELIEILNELQVVYVTNKDTHTIYEGTQKIHEKLIRAQEYFENKNQIILIIEGGL